MLSGNRDQNTKKKLKTDLDIFRGYVIFKKKGTVTKFLLTKYPENLIIFIFLIQTQFGGKFYITPAIRY
jgi:hypothetical protein